MASPTRIPLATYRLQLNRQFTFADAAKLQDYFYALGVSDCYVSPIFRANPGSTHGYDVIDHSQINPELGGEEQLAPLAEGLRARDMGILLDLVPNHMYIASAENHWWADVLENGPSSPFARHFDIDWEPPKADLANKVLLPILGDQYGRVLERREIQIRHEGGAFFVQYYEHRFPLAPKSWAVILEAALGRLRGRIDETDIRVLELESIITALSHLPSRSETGPALVRERQREKEIIKRRLLVLVEQAPEVGRALEESLAELNGRRGDPRSFDRLEALLADQAYRLSFWRVASDEINYRRFFDVNELAAIRMEEPAVHEAVHAWPLKLLERGWLTGLRIDHIDGLLDPLDYLHRLPQSDYLVVEKILVRDERLHTDWPVQGTTGYEFLNILNGLFVDPAAQQKLRDVYARFTGVDDPFADIVYECKSLILRVAMSSELTVLARKLDRISEQHRFSRDFTYDSLYFALAEIIACFPVYRSYIRPGEAAVSPADRRCILAATRAAKLRNPATSESLFDFIESVLLLEDPEGLDESQVAERRDFVMRFQQLSSPVMAKGLEDTAFYRFYPLASLNEVGGDPDMLGASVERFHLANQERQQRWPRGLSTTSTHDTKRAEDVRARINVLSEIPKPWEEAIKRWRALNRERRVVIEGLEAPSANEEYLLYQTLVGTWPLEPLGGPGYETYVERIQDYMRKALREAKLHTSWINPFEEYEEAIHDFVRAALTPSPDNQFLADFVPFQAGIVRSGLLNSVSQLLLKIGSPGVPDFYQGTEIWDFSLVDPDNRRPVDFAHRQALLASLEEEARGGLAALADRLLDHLEDGRLKLYVMSCALDFRRRCRDVFEDGEYVPVGVAGLRRRHVVAFARAFGRRAVIVAAARFFTRLPPRPVGAEAWGATTIRLSGELGGTYREILTDRELTATVQGSGAKLAVGDILAHLPIALLERIT